MCPNPKSQILSKGGITPIAAFAFAPLLGYLGDKVVEIIVFGVVVIAIVITVYDGRVPFEFNNEFIYSSVSKQSSSALSWALSSPAELFPSSPPTGVCSRRFLAVFHIFKVPRFLNYLTLFFFSN